MFEGYGYITAFDFFGPNTEDNDVCNFGTNQQVNDYYRTIFKISPF